MQQSLHSYLAHGQTPAFRLPLAPATPHAHQFDAAIIGVPHDAGSTYQPGSRFAPFAVRRLSALATGYHATHGLQIFETLAACDAGNVVFAPFERADMRRAVEAEAARWMRLGTTPLLIGGDHSITLPALRAAHAVHGPLAIVHIDAHLDLSSPEMWGDAYHHGTTFRHAVTEGLVAEGAMCQLGMRGPRVGPDDDQLVRGAHLTLTLDELAHRGLGYALAQIRERVGTRPTYLSFDLDAVDPSAAPGTGTPVPGGLLAREALALVRGLSGLRLVGADVVEYCPMLDHADITGHLTVQLMWEMLGLCAQAKRARNTIA